MDNTSPVILFTLIKSPTSKEPSPIKNKPLIKLETDVCEAKPIATVKIPAAPNNTPILKPISCRPETVKRSSKK